MAGGEPRDLFLHACGSTAADDAERRAAKEVFPRAPIHEISSITGSLSAAGGLNLAAAALSASNLDATGLTP